uniref:Uncharacterized protein n=1 Tax=Anguilla anguilla TaxID=7936 RepID=A0A0E9W7S6_ANGAN
MLMLSRQLACELLNVITYLQSVTSV